MCSRVEQRSELGCANQQRRTRPCHRLPPEITKGFIAAAMPFGAPVMTAIFPSSLRILSSFSENRSPPAAADQVDIGAHFRERIARWVDAIKAWDGIEDDLPSLRHLVIHARRQNECAERNLRA